ncbi:DEAD/DEAH box helicase domain-containing protein [Ditylenchus destructor]|uniref:RNA helicase n=1 Tax=Ditylenchus destructor TaxID=166010 RepID=A0AAD4RA94_9BILA|nr:DEAD/DEAH box helicase domain-containing protein [Ditylenchus destructor]
MSSNETEPKDFVEAVAESTQKSFADLGINEVLCEACERLGWEKPTPIQEKCLEYALQDRDLIALAETGSGKTGAFALPILQSLMANPQKLFALVLTPTRELAFQITEQFEALGAAIGLIVSTIVGGIDMATQTLSLAKRPHVIVATPGRLVDHLENTRGFNLKSLKYVVMDEADRILNMDFEIELEKILRVIPKSRHTFLFSATMTKKVSKLERASLKDPIKVELSSKYQTVGTLIQNYLFVPHKYKEAYLVYVINERPGNTAIIFCGTCAGAVKLALLLRQLGIGAVSLHGQMSQPARLGALNKFKKKERLILVCTDVASRGLDIPNVDMVINYDVPNQSKDYVHRVGRTARAGKSGTSLTLVTQYDVELYLKIEQALEKKLIECQINHNDVMQLVERVSEAARHAAQRYKELEENKGSKRKSTADDDDEGPTRKFNKASVKKIRHK